MFAVAGSRASSALAVQQHDTLASGARRCPAGLGGASTAVQQAATQLAVLCLRGRCHGRTRHRRHAHRAPSNPRPVPPHCYPHGPSSGQPPPTPRPGLPCMHASPPRPPIAAVRTHPAQAMLNIARSVFTIALLVLGFYFLNRDSRQLVLQPIERMVARVQVGVRAGG